MQLVEVEVMRLGLDRSTNSYVVILQEKGGARLLPIWIGQVGREQMLKRGVGHVMPPGSA